MFFVTCVGASWIKSNNWPVAISQFLIGSSVSCKCALSAAEKIPSERNAISVKYLKCNTSPSVFTHNTKQGIEVNANKSVKLIDSNFQCNLFLCLVFFFYTWLHDYTKQSLCEVHHCLLSPLSSCLRCRNWSQHALVKDVSIPKCISRKRRFRGIRSEEAQVYSLRKIKEVWHLKYTNQSRSRTRFSILKLC